MGQVTSLFVHKIVAAAGPGIDTAGLLRGLGLDPDAAPDPATMVSDTAYYALIEDIAQQIDVTDLPLRTGASMACDNYGALGLAYKAAPTLRGSCARVVRYARLWTSVVEYDLQPQGQDNWFMLLRSGPRRLGLRLSNEATLASSVAIAREVTEGGRFSPLEVHLQHPPPEDISHHQAYFGCPVVFNSDRDALLISKAALERPNRLGDAGITRFLLSHLDQELAHIAPQTSIRDQTSEVIARALSEGVPKMEDVARRLGMSVRSLHRRLADDGISFQTLSEETRRSLAEGLLGDARYSLSEVAFLTGFSEQSAFTRAFKRWAGLTPASFRKARLKP